MSQKSFRLTEERLSRYPMDWMATCQSCGRKFYTKLKMEHDRHGDQLLFYRDRFCNCKPGNTEILIEREMDENEIEYQAPYTRR